MLRQQRTGPNTGSLQDRRAMDGAAGKDDLSSGNLVLLSFPKNLHTCGAPFFDHHFLHPGARAQFKIPAPKCRGKKGLGCGPAAPVSRVDAINRPPLAFWIIYVVGLR